MVPRVAKDQKRFGVDIEVSDRTDAQIDLRLCYAQIQSCATLRLILCLVYEGHSIYSDIY